MKLHIINVIWGSSYIKTYLEFSLPSQLAEGNLPGFAKIIPAIYIFYTTEKDKEKLEKSPLLKKLRTHIPVEFRILDSLKTLTDYERMSLCHKKAIKEANYEDAALIFLSPDAIFSTNVFSFVASHLKSGKRLIAICSTRLSYEGMRSALSSRSALSLSSGELTTIALKHLHRRIQLSFIQNGMIISHPSQIYWKLDENNILVKAFHLHPLLIWPEKKDLLPEEPIDSPRYIGAACPNFETWEIISDSKSIAVYELTADSQFSDMVTMPLTPFLFQKWGRKNLTKWSHFFASHSIILGNGEKQASWIPIKKDAEELIHSLLNNKVPYFINISILVSIYYLKVIKNILLGKKKLNLKNLKKHIGHIKGNFVFYQ